MQVLKFGGTSVNDAKAIAQVAAIAADQLKTDPNVVVVTSAMRGVTDLLINSAKAAASGDRQRYRDARCDAGDPPSGRGRGADPRPG